ncbi:MAG: hypothetical protein C7B45_13990 [Sulfobacillus acidophilus]|uniref:Urease accessory protein UreH-like transmembrane domain-containing protein n=1 Tax=Sulfobacillus acidophilus TaxID=53633 RepID=A0A2T2WEE9_9FIRM|nr:MAG: hypothetical protein C7B45_13990 [Sulfobacillus acidophilus]
MVNLWDPHIGLAVGVVLATAFLLGMVHGITPDEHTWPITFSYAIGSYSTRKGIIAGLTFSAAFTVQRAIASELAYLAFDRWFTIGSIVDYIVYIIVGSVMIWAARYILRGQHWHLLAFGHHNADTPTAHDVKWWMPLIHGFIAGWGFGAFAVIIYTVLAPSMPSAWVAWIPGFLFGLGTTAIQAAAGGLFGWVSRHMKLTTEQIRQVSLKTAGNTLNWGGVIFVLAGIFGLAFPRLAGFQIDTGIKVHNLHDLGIAFVLVMITVLVIGVGTLIRETRRAGRENAQKRVQQSTGTSRIGLIH